MSPSATSEYPSYSIACIPADGIGPEVIDAGVEVLQTLSDAAGSFQFHFKNYDWSSKTYLETGRYIPDGGLESLKKHDAILFGAVGAPGEYTTINKMDIVDFSKTSRTISASGAYGWPSASPFSSTPMSDPQRSSKVHKVLSAMPPLAILTGLSSVKIARVNMLVKADALTVDYRGRLALKSPFSQDIALRD